MSQTTPIEMPKFDFSAPVLVSDTEATKLLNADKIPPNTEVVLEILKCTWRGMTEKDPTWGNFSFIFGLPGTILDDNNKGKTADGKFASVIWHNQMVPLTSKNLYNEERAPQQAERFVKFVSAMGIEASIGNYAHATKPFENCSSLKGTKLLCYVGYEKDHIAQAEGRFYIANKQGKPAAFEGNSFLSRDQAEGAAIRFGFDVADAFLKIKRFSPVAGAATSSTPIAVPPIEEEY